MIFMFYGYVECLLRVKLAVNDEKKMKKLKFCLQFSWKLIFFILLVITNIIQSVKSEINKIIFKKHQQKIIGSF